MVVEEVLIVGLVLHVPDRRLRREDRMGVVPAYHVHRPPLDRRAHLHLRQRVGIKILVIGLLSHSMVKSLRHIITP